MRLTRSLNHPLSRSRHTYLTARTDGRRWSPPDYFAQACRFLSRYVRLTERMARREPHIYGPHASRYYQDTLQAARDQIEIERALARVYGQPGPNDPPPAPGVFTRRYILDPQWRGFRQWFRNTYGT